MDAYEEGYNAGWWHFIIKDNPYNTDASEYKEWENGFYVGIEEGK